MACHPRLWLRVDRSVKDLSQPGVFPNIETAVSASRHVNLMLLCIILDFSSGCGSDCRFFSYRPGDTILIAAGGSHHTSNIQIKKPLCLVSYLHLLYMVVGESNK